MEITTLMLLFIVIWGIIEIAFFALALDCMQEDREKEVSVPDR